MDEEVAGIIVEQARQEHTTDIQVIQRAVDRHAHWHLWEEKFGFISVPSSMEQKLMSLLSEEQARDLGRELAETFAQDFPTWPAYWPLFVTWLVLTPTSSCYKSTARRTILYRFSTTGGSKCLFSGRK
jgi:hypothetical protein